MALTFLGQQKVESTQANFEIVRQVLQIGIDTHGIFPIMFILCGIVLDFLENGEIERAVDLPALLWKYPVVANSQWFRDIAGQEIAAAVDNLSLEIAGELQERGRDRDIWETARELLDELKDRI